MSSLPLRRRALVSFSLRSRSSWGALLLVGLAGVADVRHGVLRLPAALAAADLDGHALEGGGQERAPIVLRAPLVPGGIQRHEAGEVLVLGTEPVEGPRPHGWAHELEAAGVELGGGLGVGGDVGVHAAQEAQVVGLLADLRQELRDHQAALSAGLERPGGAHELGAATEAREAGAVPLGEHGLVVEGVHVGRGAGHAQEDDPLRPPGQGGRGLLADLGGGDAVQGEHAEA